MKTELPKRHPRNPILTPADIPGGANSVFNSAAAKRGDNMAVLRVERRDGLTDLLLAESADGIRFKVLREILVPEEEPWLTYEGARYDPRITRIEDTYYIAYCIENDRGVQCSLARTRGFETFEKVALPTEPNNRNVVLFPERIGGPYRRPDRPFTTNADAEPTTTSSPHGNPTSAPATSPTSASSTPPSWRTTARCGCTTGAPTRCSAWLPPNWRTWWSSPSATDPASRPPRAGGV